MNHCYRVIFNALTGAWVAVAETTKARGKSSRPVRVLAPLLALSLNAYAVAPLPGQLPTGGQVVAGQATIGQAGTVMSINQTSNRAAIEFQTFNVGAQARVNVSQPTAASVMLMRVLDSQASQIYGTLSANGQVFLSNPNGVYFSPSATVDVGALVATSHGISNADFMAGRNVFSRNGASGSVVNDGTLTAAPGGYIALLAPEVQNNGVVKAQAGTVALAAGEVITLQFDGANTSLIVTPSQIASLVENRQAVLAPGGQIILSAQAANRLQGGVVKNTGSLEATGLSSDGGVIILMASDSISNTGSIKADGAPGSAGKGGTITLIADLANPASTTQVGGTLSARGGDLGGDGGFVETSAAHVQIVPGALVDTRAPKGKTGTWLLDPVDYTIAASGGDEMGAAVSASLLTTNRSITAGVNLNVNDAVSWSANLLTLTATAGDINISALMSATGTSTLALNPSGGVNVGFDGAGNFGGRVDFGGRSGTGLLTINGVGGTVIGSLAYLQSMNGDLAGRYALGGSFSVAGFTQSVGSVATPFTGVLNGLGNTLSDFSVSAAGSGAGMFAATSNTAVIRNLGLTNVSVTGGNNVGALVGSNGGQIFNSYTTGTVSGSGSWVGGLVGSNQGQITNSYSRAAVSGGDVVGGLVGSNWSSGTISYSHAHGDVVSPGGLGGLIGSNSGQIQYSFAWGNVTGSAGGSSGDIGGLVGFNASSGVIDSCYAMGNVVSNNTTAYNFVGGLVGYNNGTLSSTYAAGGVTGAGSCGAGNTNNSAAGGLVGYNDTGSISNSYATGRVTGSGNDQYSFVGGLLGYNFGGSVSTSYAIGSVSETGTHSGLAYLGKLAGYKGAAGTFTNTFWIGDTPTTGVGSGVVAGATQLTATAAKQKSNFTGFSFTATPGGAGWVMVDGNGTLNNALGAAGGALPMLAMEYSTGIKTVHQLQLMVMAPGASYTLHRDLNASASGNGADVWGNAGFIPVGSSAMQFYGTFDGQGHVIDQLSINASATPYAGLFGWTSGATISNVGLTNASVTGTERVGVLAGYLNGGSIANSYATGTVLARGSNSNYGIAGGLVGYLQYAAISNSHASVAVTADVTTSLWSSAGGLAGGLVGVADNASSPISNSYATGAVAALGGTGNALGSHAGGLIGRDINTSIDSSYATGSVTNTGVNANSGGLVGEFNMAVTGHINDSYATGAVNGVTWVGGLVGVLYSNGTVTLARDYATGSVTGTTVNVLAGGLIGYVNNTNSFSLAQSYATGAVSSSVSGASLGGLIGLNYEGNASSVISNSFASGSVTGTGGGYVGGLIGWNRTNNSGGSLLSVTYASGSVSGIGGSVGGLVGSNMGTVNKSFFDTTTTGQSVGIGSGSGSARGMATADMQAAANFTSATAANGNVNPLWDFTTPIWRFVSGANGGYACLAGTPSCVAPLPPALISSGGGGALVGPVSGGSGGGASQSGNAGPVAPLPPVLPVPNVALPAQAPSLVAPALVQTPPAAQQVLDPVTPTPAPPAADSTATTATANTPVTDTATTTTTTSGADATIAETKQVAQAQKALAVASSPKFVAFRAAETARHEAATALYRPALDILRQKPDAADVPSCSRTAADACIPAPKAASAGTGIRHKVAVLFGNNAYKGNIPALATPAGDVRAVGEVLKKRMGYEVRVIENAGKRDIILALKQLAESAGPEDSLVVMYAGHGYEMEESKQGFWLPVDADAKDPKSWVSNNDITRLLNANPAKQILLVSDSCFSGTLTQEQKVETRGVSSQEILGRRSVVALSSGGEEPVSDEGLNGHSIFAYHLLQTLGSVKERTTASEIHRSVKEEVEKDFPQEPQLGGVLSAGHTRGGDYLFRMN